MSNYWQPRTFAPGDRVRVLAGPWTGWIGTVDSIEPRRRFHWWGKLIYRISVLLLPGHTEQNGNVTLIVHPAIRDFAPIELEPLEASPND